MTELERYEPRDDAPLATIDGLARLQETALALDASHRMASALVRTGFVPAAFKGKAEEAAAAMLAGAEVGLSPLASLRSFDLINGVAAPRAQALRAIAQSQGHEVWVVEANDQRAVVCGRRRGSQQVEQVTWTMDRARKAGLASKSNWQANPEAMLVARATAEVCRRIASDALLGIGYAVEELDEPATVVSRVEPVNTRTEPPRRVAQRAPLAPAPAVTDDEPAFDEPTTPEPEPQSQSEPDGITDAQMRKLGALMRKAGITERIKALQYVEQVVDRPIQSRSDLTKGEASAVIDALTADQDAPATTDQAEPDPWDGAR